MQECFHERVKRLRESKGLSLAKLSKRSGLSEALISLLETDANHAPTWLTISKLASALHVNPYYLASGDGDDKPFKVSHQVLDERTYSRQTRRK